MTRESNEVEQAVSRTVRDSLEKLQRSTEELNQAVNDVVASCASARPSNALSPMVRAQTAAASLAASLEVLSRFVAGALQMSSRPAVELEPEPRAVVEPVPASPKPAPVVLQSPPEPPPVETIEPLPASDSRGVDLSFVEELPPPEPVLEQLPPVAAFDISTLPPEEQDLHRRANRVAKVSMQDIKLLRPNDVTLGREHKDLCIRLRDDIEKAHKEYDRRFQAILGHPVDYFYDWMVEILGDGNANALGEYPYPSPVLRH